MGRQIPAPQHGCKRQRHEPGDQNCNDDRDRKLVHDPPHHAAQKQNRDENRNQRKSHRKDRETDFSRRQNRCLDSPSAHFEMAHDVFEHNDRIIDDKSNRKRQRHQGEVVQAVAEQVHHGKCSDDG